MFVAASEVPPPFFLLRIDAPHILMVSSIDAAEVSLDKSTEGIVALSSSSLSYSVCSVSDSMSDSDPKDVLLLPRL